MVKQVTIGIWDDGYTVEYHKDDAEGNDHLYQEVCATKAALKAKLLEIFS